MVRRNFKKLRIEIEDIAREAWMKVGGVRAVRYEAASWYVRLQESEPIDPRTRDAFAQWIISDPRHKKAYESVTSLLELLEHMPARGRA